MRASGFLLNSDEMKIFSRPSGDIEKMLGNLPKQSTDLLVDRFKYNLGVKLVCRLIKNFRKKQVVQKDT
jgi:hypothetical protein